MKNKRQYHLEHPLPVSEAAEICRQTARQMERYIKEKKLRAVRVRNEFLIRRSDLDTFIKEYGRRFVRPEDIEAKQEYLRFRRSRSPHAQTDRSRLPGATEMKNWLEPDNASKEKIDVSTEPSEAPGREAAGDGLLSVKEVAAFVGVHAKTIRRWTKRSDEKLSDKRQGKPK